MRPDVGKGDQNLVSCGKKLVSDRSFASAGGREERASCHGISVERDKYLKHHSGYGGVPWVYGNAARDIDAVTKVLTSIDGVETVLTRSDAVKRFHLMASRIGDLIVLGDRTTVFGELDAPSEPLQVGRAHV